MPEQLEANAERGLTLLEAALREGNITTALGFAFAEVRAELARADELNEDSLDRYAGQQLTLDVLKVAGALIHLLADEYDVDIEGALRAIRQAVENSADDSGPAT